MNLKHCIDLPDLELRDHLPLPLDRIKGVCHYTRHRLQFFLLALGSEVLTLPASLLVSRS